MQSDSTIAAAAVAQERNPTQTLKVDWDANGNYTDTVDDLTARVESLTITRQLATDLPDEVQGMTGYSSAQLDATLSGDPTTESTNAASYFSPFNTASALYGKRRRWRSCQAKIGFGSTLLTKFTGKTTALQVDSASRTATLQALDNAETMRGVVDLPVVVADNQGTFRPGLNSSWVVDYIARKCGYYAAPPRRANAIFHASFAGSAYPSLGSINSVTGAAGELLQYANGKWIQAVKTDPSATGYNLKWTTSAGASTNNGSSIFIECWYYPTSFTNPAILTWLHNTSQDPNSPYVALYVTTAAKVVLEARMDSSSGGAIWDPAATLTANTWHYLAGQITFTSSGATFRVRIDGSTHTDTIVVSATGQPSISDLSLEARSFTSLSGATVNASAGPAVGYIEALQIETYGYGANEPGTGGTPGWNNTFTPTATIQPSLNTLNVAVPAQSSAWDLIQQIAAAEFATTGFDEFGNFFFYNRNRWTSAPYTTSQRTINASDSLTAIQTSETTDQLRNHVRITATPATLDKAGWVWVASTVISVPASGSTTVTADMGSPVYSPSTSISYASTSGVTGHSVYRANRNRDGSGTNVSNLTFGVTVSAGQIATITITNPNAFVVYLVSGSGFTDPAGTPSLALWGQSVVFAESAQPDTTALGVTIPAQTIVDVSDATSVSQHGDQLLDLSGNPWMQDGGSLTTLANDLLARLKDPAAMLDGLTIVGDPRLQLGDRVTIVEPTLGLSGDFFLTGIVDTFDDSGYTQALTVRAIS